MIVLVGPTAVGKTDTALQLAERMNGEIVSADSRLFYRGMDIGTAKPSKQDRARVPHHLIDIAEPDETVSLAEFQQKAQLAIADIYVRSKVPFLVGGTGQYIRAVAEGWKPPQVRADERLRSALDRMIAQNGGEWIHERLRSMDPAAAERIDPRNIRRSVRAMEVILTTGRKFSDQRSRVHDSHPFLGIGLRRPRKELYARIDDRIENMIAQGFLDEVSVLISKGYSPDLPSMSAIGYRECMKVIAGEWQLDEAKAEMKRLTRIYVRRQSNWFKESDPSLTWFEAGDSEVVVKIESFLQSSRINTWRVHQP